MEFRLNRAGRQGRMLSHTCQRHPDWPRLPDRPSIALRENTNKTSALLEYHLVEKTQNLGATWIDTPNKTTRGGKRVVAAYQPDQPVVLKKGLTKNEWVRKVQGMHGRRRRGRGELKGSGPPRQWPEHLPSIWLICAASFAQCKGRNFSEPTVGACKPTQATRIRERR